MEDGQGAFRDNVESHVAPPAAMPRTVRRIVREELQPLIDLAEEIRRLLRLDRDPAASAVPAPSDGSGPREEQDR